jgi:A/G-specific adenine glycosylase
MRAWAGLGYYSRARNLHACAGVIVREHGGHFPKGAAALRQLPGIGPYTAAAIAAIAFDQPEVPVDGNVERVVARLFRVENPLPGAKPLIGALAAALAPPRRHGDFAQALMDLGATICTPRSPSCLHCPWQDGCAARERGDPETFPVKVRKSAGRMRFGAAFVAVRADGMILVRTRPPKGLLGGMTEVPTTAWQADVRLNDPAASAPLEASWLHVGTVEHVFTHFPLRLDVYRAEIPDGVEAPGDCRWMPAAGVADEAFPNLFRKVLEAAGIHGGGVTPLRRPRRIRA